MRKSLLAGAALGALIMSAMAADMPPAALPAFSWTGYYVGANIGWGSVDDDGAPFCVNPAGVLDGPGCVTNNVPGAQTNGDGIVFGGQAGYNWQAGNWVFGVETDIQNADLNGSVNITGPFRIVGGGPSASVSNFTADEKVSWFGTLRGRAGVAWDRSLFYATAGVAYGGATVDQNTIFPSVAYPSTASATKTGWIAGGGWEFALTGNWSGKVEGLYYDLGSISTSGGPTVPAFGYVGGKNFDVQGEIVRVGLNWRFGGPGYGY
jgi:outer membrane immunogenic protein